MSDDKETPEQADDDLLERLRRAMSHADPVPAGVAAAAKAAFIWRTIDAELAELADDALLEAGAGGVLVRGGAGAERLLTFESPELTVELEAASTGRSRRILGQLIPPQQARIEVRHGGGTAAVDTDEMGVFALVDLAPGPVSIRCRPGPPGRRDRRSSTPTGSSSDRFVSPVGDWHLLTYRGMRDHPTREMRRCRYLIRGKPVSLPSGAGSTTM